MKNFLKKIKNYKYSIILVSCIFVLLLVLPFLSRFSSQNVNIQREILKTYSANEDLITKLDFKKDFDPDYLSDEKLDITSKFERSTFFVTDQSSSSQINSRENDENANKIDKIINKIDETDFTYEKSLSVD
jgi:hypothetical protein